MTITKTIHGTLLSLALALPGCIDGAEIDSTSEEIDLGVGGGAGSETVQLCFFVANNFLNNGGDFPNGTVNYAAKGVRFKVTDSSGTDTFYWANKNTGCKNVTLDSLGTYTVRMYSKAELVDGNTFKLMKDDYYYKPFGWTSPTSVKPAQMIAIGGVKTRDFVWPASPGGDYTDNIATALSAIYRTFNKQVITTNKHYRIYAEDGPCSSPCMSLDKAGNRAVFLNGSAKLPPNNGPVDLRDKFAIAHEVAHLSLYLRLGGKLGSDGGHSLDGSLDDDKTKKASPCATGDGHSFGSAALPMGTEEWGNSAFNEGWAQYASASTWNRRGDNDCNYRGTNSWNDCYDPGLAFDACYTANNISHRKKTGFERDWLQTFWAIERLDGCAINFEVIAEIVVGASPKEWKNDDAKQALWDEASNHLSGTQLTCFRDTLDARILF